MKTKKLELKNGYMCLYHLTIDLIDELKGFVALIDSNGCGKSSVFGGILLKHNSLGRIGGYLKRKLTS